MKFRKALGNPSCFGAALLCAGARGLESLLENRWRQTLAKVAQRPLEGQTQSGRKSPFVHHNPIMWPGCGANMQWHRDRKLITHRANQSFINPSEFHEVTRGPRTTELRPPTPNPEPADTSSSALWHLLENSNAFQR